MSASSLQWFNSNIILVKEINKLRVMNDDALCKTKRRLWSPTLLFCVHWWSYAACSQPLLPRVKSTGYTLRPRAHVYELPKKDNRNFMSRVSYTDIKNVTQSMKRYQVLVHSFVRKQLERRSGSIFAKKIYLLIAMTHL